MWSKIEQAVSAFLLLTMVSVSSLQILVRYFPSEILDFFWTEELSRLLLVWLTFWGATAVQRSGDHISLAVVADVLPRDWQPSLHLLSETAIVVALAFLAWYGWEAAQLILVQQTVGLGVTIAVFAFSVPVCSVLMIGYTLNMIWRRIQGKSLESATSE